MEDIMSYTTDKLTLQAYFHFSRMPFTKKMWAKQMFESQSQGELKRGLELWVELQGICLVSGPNGAGKSITLRRLCYDLSNRKKHEVFYMCLPRCSPIGFFRSLCRSFGLLPRQNLSDMFDNMSSILANYEEKTGKHPILIVDDADSLTDDTLEALRRLLNFDMDHKIRWSLILSAIPNFVFRLRQPHNTGLHQRICFSHYLKGFSLEDTREYIAFHLQRAHGPKELFSDDAILLLFNLSRGFPRVINQFAIHSLIRAATLKADAINAAFIKSKVLSNPLFEAPSA